MMIGEPETARVHTVNSETDNPEVPQEEITNGATLESEREARTKALRNAHDLLTSRGLAGATTAPKPEDLILLADYIMWGPL